MHIFSEGIKITDVEYKCLLHIVTEPETWLLDSIIEKGRLRRNALIKDWQPILFADPSITELPADDEGLCNLIMARDDYKSRADSDADRNPESFYAHNTVRYEAIDRSGTTITLFADGIDVTDMDYNCILAYVQDLDDWVLGALLGQINRGKKHMLREWQPVIIADSNVATMPATENGLIEMIVARDDYQTRKN